MKTKTHKGVVHFTIGDTAGILLMQIAQEHLTEANDPVKALKTLTDSLRGCPTDLALKILKGDVVLIVDTEDQSIMPTERIPEIHDKLFPKIDVIYWMQSRTKEIERYAEQLKDGFNEAQIRIRKNYGVLNIDFPYETIMKFVSGNNEAMLDELKDNPEISALGCLFTSAKGFIERTMKIQSIMDFMLNSWRDFDQFINQDEYIRLKAKISESLTLVMIKIQETSNLQFSMDEFKDDSVQRYIQAAVEIDKVISKGIEPVNILDNWNAGWLSPEAEFYGLNGDIANLLHIQIADALQEKGIMPEDDENGMEINSFGWLEQHGWVKTHDGEINFAGCINHRIELPDVDMTKAQIKAIYEYGQICCKGILKMGWRKEFLSAARFQMDAEADLPGLYKRYFEF